MGFVGRDNEVSGLILLQHSPHRVDIITGKAPVALRVEIAKTDFSIEAELDPGDAVGDLASDEFEASSWAFMIEEDSGTRVHVVALAIIHGDPMPVELGDAVRTAWVERRGLVLRNFNDLAKHFGRTGLVEADVVIGQTDRVEQSSDAECGGFAGQDGLSEGSLNKRLRGEVVDLVGLVVSHDVDHRNLVKEVAGDEFEVVLEVADSLKVQRGTASNHSDDVVTLGQKEFGQVGAVLSSDSCDECSFAHCVIPLGEWGHRPW